MGHIKTARLQLRPLDGSHIDSLHEMSVDREVRRYLWEDEIIPRERVEEMVRLSEACFADHGTGFYAMYLADADDPAYGEFVGFCGHRIYEDGHSMELLFGMLPRFWGRGFGQEAARRVLEHGFKDCGIERVLAVTDTPNQRSVRVLQRLGMSFAKRGERHGLDTMFYEVTSTDFEAS